MKWSAVSVAAFCFVALCSACSGPAPGPAPRHHALSLTGTRDCVPNNGVLSGAEIVDAKVRWLPAGSFDFIHNGGNDVGGSGTYVRPPAVMKVMDGSSPLTYASDLAAAFEKTPPWYRKSLCGLDAVFVFEPDSSNSQGGSPSGWAFWETPDQALQAYQNDNTQPIAPQQFIGISSSIWSLLKTNSDPLGAYETQVLQTLLQFQSPATYPSVASTVAGNSDPWSLTLLGILSHELGHVLWHSECSRGCDEVHRYGWTDVGTVAHLHKFGATGDAIPLKPDYYYTVPDVAADWTTNSGNPPASKLYKLYFSGIWPSLFGFVAPDEDMAETIKLLILSKSGLSSLTVKLSASVVKDMVTYLKQGSSAPLLKKAKQIRGSLQSGD